MLNGRNVALAASAAAALVATGCSRTSPVRRADEPLTSLSVRELTVVDERGEPRVRIGAPLPSPKGLRRATPAVGIQFLDAEGREVGGLAMLDAIGVRGLCFDSEEGYEAMCVGLVKGEPSVTFRHDWKERIELGVSGGVARVVLYDAQGTPRLHLEVAPDGTTRVAP